MRIFGTGAGGAKEEKDAFSALERRLDSLESGMRLLKTEWIDVHERLNRVMGRLVARQKRNEAVEGPVSDEPSQPEGQPQRVAPGGTHAILQAARRHRG